MMRPRPWPVVLAILAFAAGAAAGADDGAPRRQFLDFIRQRAATLRADDPVPQTAAAWQARRTRLRHDFEQAWGSFPATPCPLEPKKLGTLVRDGYRVERWIFQTRPGVWMTAHCYVPDAPGRHPAILAVHGHWPGAKQDPRVQRRCIGSVRRGYVVLAVDFLQTRADVDPQRIGITGASGGGNQSMYAGAWDDRFGAVVPVCSVGTYQAYLGTACCMCEVVPAVLQFTEQWAVLGMIAPRGLLVINATQDDLECSVGEARKSLDRTGAVFALAGRPGGLRHAVFDEQHDYSQAMREAMYGFMDQQLRGAGRGDPIAESPMTTEDPETLRCFPGDSRPDDWTTIPRFAAAQGRAILETLAAPSTAGAWRDEAAKLRHSLARLLGGFPAPAALDLRAPEDTGRGQRFSFSPEPGLTLTATRMPVANGRRLAVLLDAEGAAVAAAHPLGEALRAAGWSTVTFDLRATGGLAWPSDALRGAPDHASAAWALSIGRPLVGQWVWDVRRCLDAVAVVDAYGPAEIAVVGFGPAGIAALASSALDPRVTHCVTVDTLASYLTDSPYVDQRLAIMIPRIIPDVGDVPHLAALAQAKRLVIAGGGTGDGRRLDDDARATAFRFTTAAAALGGPSVSLVATDALPAVVADRERF